MQVSVWSGHFVWHTHTHIRMLWMSFQPSTFSGSHAKEGFVVQEYGPQDRQTKITQKHVPSPSTREAARLHSCCNNGSRQSLNLA